MKLEINGFVVEIKAKANYGNKRFNKKDTIYFLNDLAVLFREAGEYNREHWDYDMNYPEVSRKLHDFLDNLGAYDQIRKEIENND